MSGDKLDGVLDALGAHEDCLSALPRLAVLAQVLGGLKTTWGLNVMLPDRQLPAKLGALGDSLTNSDKISAPVSFSLAPAVLAALGRLAMVAASLAVLRRRFGVNPHDPDSIQKFRRTLQGLSGRGAVKMPDLHSRLLGLLTPRGRIAHSPTLPQLSQANLDRVGVLATTSAALRKNLGINMLKPHAGFQIGRVSERLQTLGFFRMLRLPRPATSPSKDAVTIIAFTGALRSVKRGFGIDLLQPKPGAKQAMTALLEPDSPLTLLCIEVASASYHPEVHTDLPIIRDLEARVGLVSALALAQSSLGLNLRDPDAPIRAQAMLRSLESSGACAAAQSTPIGPKEIDGLGRLRTHTSAMAASRSALGANILAPGATYKLESAIKSFASNGGSDLVSPIRVSPDMLAGLGKLATLAAA